MLHENAPVFAAVPPMRCQRRTGSGPADFCRAPASWLRPGDEEIAPAYFCDAHHEPTDVAIGTAGAFLRVRVMCDITLAAASWNAREAKNEAVLTVERAVQQAGGLLNVIQVTAVVGQFADQPPRGGQNGRGDDPK